MSPDANGRARNNPRNAEGVFLAHPNTEFDPKQRDEREQAIFEFCRRTVAITAS